MTQAIFWSNLFFGYFFIFGEEYLLLLTSLILLTLIFVCIIKSFLNDY